MTIHLRTERRNPITASTAVECAWDHAEIHHLSLVPFEAKLCLYSVLGPSQNEPDQVRLALVRFGRHTFDLDPSGTLAIIAPIVDEGQMVNLAAFSFEEDGPRKLFRPGHFAVRLADARWDARVRPDRKLLVHFSVWSWLKSGLQGALPVDWRGMVVHVLGERFGLRHASRWDGQRARAALIRAARLPQSSAPSGDAQ